MGSLKEVLDCFVLFQKVLTTETILERVARETIEDVAREGIKTVELRYSPSFVSEYSQLDWRLALGAIERGISMGSKATGVQARLICIISRDYGSNTADKTVDFAVAHKESFVALDLAGNEVDYPNPIFAGALRRARDAGFSITVHSGEATGPETVWQAIDELGAQRIGHGIHSIKDPELVKRLVRDRIHLEVCPTSNVNTRSVASWGEHPLRRLFDAGVRVSINTDDPGIFGVGLDEEVARAKKAFGFSEPELATINSMAFEDLFKVREI